MFRSCLIAILLEIFLLSGNAFSEESLFAPTPMDVVEKALKVAKIQKFDIVYDLGCGDSRVIIAASKFYGCRSVGIDFSESCIRLSQENIKLNDIGKLVEVKLADVLETDFSDATVVFIYLMPELSEKLIPKLKKLKSGSRIIAHDKPIPGWKPLKVFEVKSKVGNKKHFIYFYVL